MTADARNKPATAAIACLLLAACNPPAADPEGSAANPTSAPDAKGWDLQSSGEGTALALLDANGTSVVRLFCPSRSGRLLVNVPGFRPVGSEERMTVGSGGTAVALVAGSGGDPARGGVSASGPVPDELKAIAQGPLSVSYGAQTSGPHPVVGDELARAFLAACNETAEGAVRAEPARGAHPCRVQDGETLRVAPLRAVGTEPFWGARIDGRCVTYSTPEDQGGTRVWARFNPGPAGGVWSGSLGGKPFVLRTDPTGQCSDGMSDRVYPISVTLTVGGEERRGCAEPAPVGG